MKDFTQASLEAASTAHLDALQTIQFCLDQLYKDRTKRVVDEIVHCLTFEELIGALLAANRELMEQRWTDEEEE